MMHRHIALTIAGLALAGVLAGCTAPPQGDLEYATFTDFASDVWNQAVLVGSVGDQDGCLVVTDHHRAPGDTFMPVFPAGDPRAAKAKVGDTLTLPGGNVPELPSSAEVPAACAGLELPLWLVAPQR